MSELNQTKRIHEEEWDNLIILDACRYDESKSVIPRYFKGEMSLALSPASCTRDWLRLTWTEDYQDITYLSCNPFMQSQDSKHPSQYEPRHKFKRIVDVWKEGLMPEHLEKYALTVRGRKVLHYNFPHKPYHGAIKEETEEGYRANLEFILEYLQGLLPKLKGKTIITSDHGELFLRGEHIHPCSKNSPALREVPWFIYEGLIDNE
jgi:hypothetical protein